MFIETNEEQVAKFYQSIGCVTFVLVLSLIMNAVLLTVIIAFMVLR